MADFARSTDPQVQAQLDRLSKLSPAGDRLGLERIAALLERLGRPHDELPPVFHVAGTNGKGSTIAFLRAALEASGYKVHAFTSPHLVRFNERMRIAGRLIDDDELAELLSEMIDAGAGIEPSFFEIATAAAFLAFARTPADACILEVGLGGRLDATNVIEQPLVTGIANLGLDHQQFLGDELVGIAGEKAAIAKRGVPLVTQLYPPAIAGKSKGSRSNAARSGFRAEACGMQSRSMESSGTRREGRAEAASAAAAWPASGDERSARGGDASPPACVSSAGCGTGRGDGLDRLACAVAASRSGTARP